MLKRYQEKRSFERTPEPPPDAEARGEGPLTFVVQKHAARRLHYDFRLEAGGVLKSWAVPKGPSLNRKEKRLAVHVEDHPLDYASFEGIIPKGEYGGGEVIVWDCGSYSPEHDGKLFFKNRERAQELVLEGIARGKLSVVMRGNKLKGSWALVKTARAENDWLLIKHKDVYEGAERDILVEDKSVRSGLTIEDLREGRQPEAREEACLGLAVSGAQAGGYPDSVTPMFASITQGSFSHPGWLFEPKLDGMRMLAQIRDGKVKLRSRRGLDITSQYPSLCRDLAQQPAEEVILDGEVVALDERGRPSFQALQQRLNLTRSEDIRRAEEQVPVFYYVFDLLYLDGYDLRHAPLVNRKSLLRRVLLPTGRIFLTEHFEQDGETAYQAALANGLEGVMAKRKDSQYEPGRRSSHWLKIKATLTDEFVIGGYLQGQGGRSKSFGSLLLGQFDNKHRLAYTGNVGSGFDDRTLADLRERLDALQSDKSPFGEKISLPAPITWVRPEMVAEVKFAERTHDGRLRTPVFLRLREDKPPHQVHPEPVVAPPAPASSPASRRDDLASEKDVESVLEQLDNKADKLILKLQGAKIPLNNLNKRLWQAAEERHALTKRDLITYLARVSPYALPHLRDRPLTLVRYPDGIEGGRFFQKHWEWELPEFVSAVQLYTEQEGDQEYLTCDNLPTLIWLGQLADIELHTWYSRVNPQPDGHHLTTDFAGSLQNIESSLLNYPDFIVFDLDPYIYSGMESRGEEPELNRKAFKKTCEVALWLKELLDSLSLSSFVKTTGKTGLHVYAPILRQFDYDAVRSTCETIGGFLMREHPKDITMEWTVGRRTGKVFFDHNQNVRGKTLASIYSPRASPEASVSTPVLWEELGDVYPTDFTILSLPDRLARMGDLWSGILDGKRDLRQLLGIAGPEAVSR